MSWINTVKHDLWWMWQTSSFLKEEMFDPLIDLHQWMSSMHNPRSWWKSTLKKCERKCSSHVFLPAEVLKLEAVDDSFPCDQCTFVFTCFTTLRQDQSSIHGFCTWIPKPYLFAHYRHHLSLLGEGVLAPTQEFPPHSIPIQAL